MLMLGKNEKREKCIGKTAKSIWIIKMQFDYNISLAVLTSFAEKLI